MIFFTNAILNNLLISERNITDDAEFHLMAGKLLEKTSQLFFLV